MKALTLTQPWASLVALGVKMIETRSWRTHYRGPLAIHAAKGFPRDALAVCLDRPFSEVLSEHFRTPAELPRGAFVAICNLEDVTPTDWSAERGVKFSHIWDDDPETVEQLTADGWWYDMGIPVAHWPQKQWGNFEPGRWAWFLDDVQPLDPPIPYSGMQGLWDVAPAVFGYDGVLPA